MPTTKLNLPLIDGTNTADVVRDMNALANAVDNKAGASNGLATLDASGKVPASQLNVSAPPDASTSTKGVVQLSNSTTSTSEVLAATPKAVKDAKDGLSAQIGTLSGLNTTAKDNLVNAVNELFQFANDGKSKWSSVIGSPLVSTDTFTSMQTKTQTIKDTLATNLTNKGQSSVGTETLATLANKVASIATGKKFLSGVASSNNTLTSYTRSDGGIASGQFTCTVTGLDFLPSYILLKNSSNTEHTSYDSRLTSVYAITKVWGKQNSTPNALSIRMQAPASVTSTSFSLPVNDPSTSYSWIAFE